MSDREAIAKLFILLGVKHDPWDVEALEVEWNERTGWGVDLRLRPDLREINVTVVRQPPEAS